VFKTIIWATDGSETADRALPYARGLAEGTDKTLVVVHVKELLVGRGGGYPVYADEDEFVTKIEGTGRGDPASGRRGDTEARHRDDARPGALRRRGRRGGRGGRHRRRHPRPQPDLGSAARKRRAAPPPRRELPGARDPAAQGGGRCRDRAGDRGGGTLGTVRGARRHPRRAPPPRLRENRNASPRACRCRSAVTPRQSAASERKEQ